MIEQPRPERSERPESVRLTNNPKYALAPGIVHGMDFESALLEGHERSPNVIYLPDCPVSERDELMGKYISSLDKIESELSFIACSAMKQTTIFVNGVIALGLNINQMIDFVCSEAEERFSKEELQELQRWLARYKKLNTKRNRIIHGKWLFDADVGTKQDGTLYIARWQWIRQYVPSTKSERNALKRNDSKAVGKFMFSLQEIERAIREIETLVSDALTLQFRKNHEIPL